MDSILTGMISFMGMASCPVSAAIGDVQTMFQEGPADMFVANRLQQNNCVLIGFGDKICCQQITTG